MPIFDFGSIKIKEKQAAVDQVEEQPAETPVVNQKPEPEHPAEQPATKQKTRNIIHMDLYMKACETWGAMIQNMDVIFIDPGHKEMWGQFADDKAIDKVIQAANKQLLVLRSCADKGEAEIALKRVSEAAEWCKTRMMDIAQAHGNLKISGAAMECLHGRKCQRLIEGNVCGRSGVSIWDLEACPESQWKKTSLPGDEFGVVTVVIPATVAEPKKYGKKGIR